MFALEPQAARHYLNNGVKSLQWLDSSFYNLRQLEDMGSVSIHDFRTRHVI